MYRVEGTQSSAEVEAEEGGASEALDAEPQDKAASPWKRSPEAIAAEDAKAPKLSPDDILDRDEAQCVAYAKVIFEFLSDAQHPSPSMQEIRDYTKKVFRKAVGSYVGTTDIENAVYWLELHGLVTHKTVERRRDQPHFKNRRVTTVNLFSVVPGAVFSPRAKMPGACAHADECSGYICLCPDICYCKSGPCQRKSASTVMTFKTAPLEIVNTPKIDRVVSPGARHIRQAKPNYNLEPYEGVSERGGGIVPGTEPKELDAAGLSGLRDKQAEVENVNSDGYITKAQAAKALGVTETWFFPAKHTALLKRKAEGKTFLYEKASVDALAEKRLSAQRVSVKASITQGHPKRMRTIVEAVKKRAKVSAPRKAKAVPLSVVDTLRERLRFLVLGVNLEEFTMEEAFKRLSALVMQETPGP